LLIAFVIWQLLQRQWTWAWALVVLLPILVSNLRLRTSTERPGC
jgi:hypothetical protein